VIDLIEMKEIRWNDKLGNYVDYLPCDVNHPLYESAMMYRETLLDNIATFDDDFAIKYLDGVKFDNNEIHAAIRLVLNKNPLRTSPVMFGSALKNKGI